MEWRRAERARGRGGVEEMRRDGGERKRRGGGK